MILTALLKLPKNGEDWGKIIVAKGFKKLPEIQNITQSGHTGYPISDLPRPPHTTFTNANRKISAFSVYQEAGVGLSTKNQNHQSIFFKMGHQCHFFLYFHLFKQALQFLQPIYVKKCPPSMLHWDSNTKFS